MPQSRDPRHEPSHLLEEFVTRQTFVLEKLQRDGGYACEVRHARRMLRSFQARLRAAQRRR